MTNNIVLFCDSKLSEIYYSLSGKFEVLKIVTSNADYLKGSGLKEFHEIELFSRDKFYDFTDTVCFLFLFKRIINVDKIKSCGIYNVHFGILPEWRGNSCNVWALVNGSSEVGYSFHAVNNMLDGGKILWRYIYQMGPLERYSEVRDQLLEDAIERAPALLENSKDFTEISEECCTIKYTPSSKLSDAIIRCEEVTTENFLGLFRAFSGSDWGLTVRTVIGDIKVISIWTSQEVLDLYGFVGRVVNFKEIDGEIYCQIKVLNGYIYLGKVIYQGAICNMKDLVRIGMKL